MLRHKFSVKSNFDFGVTFHSKTPAVYMARNYSGHTRGNGAQLSPSSSCVVCTVVGGVA